MDWIGFREKKPEKTGTLHISWENPGFPVKMFPSTNPLKKLDIPPAMVVPQSAERRKKIDIG
jgi:hypothetical protein